MCVLTLNFNFNECGTNKADSVGKSSKLLVIMMNIEFHHECIIIIIFYNQIISQCIIMCMHAW